jgi:hypothetical protein
VAPRAFDNARRGAMLVAVFKEFRQVRQEPVAGRRRWFDDDVLPFELIVWYNAEGAVDGFQLCYNLGRGEHALTWRPEVGFAHNTVDTGSGGPFSNLTPILIPDGAVPWDELTARFDACSASLEPALRELVVARLRTK